MIPSFPKRPIRIQPNVSANQPDIIDQQMPEQAATVVPDTAVNVQPMQTSNVPSDSLPHASPAPRHAPMAQSTPVRPEINATTAATKTSHMPDLPSINDVNDNFGEDEIFDTNGGILPVTVRDGLSEIQSQMDPNTRQHVQQISDLLDRHENSRVQPLTPNPNEDQPIRRVSVFKTT